MHMIVNILKSNRESTFPINFKQKKRLIVTIYTTGILHCKLRLEEALVYLTLYHERSTIPGRVLGAYGRPENHSLEANLED